jgi:hypothetical protein
MRTMLRRAKPASAALVVAALLPPPSAVGQQVSSEPETVTEAPDHPAARVQEAELPAPVERGEPRHWWTLWTRASDRDRLIGAMWTLHLHHLDEGWSNDGAVALVYRGLYGGTFETTHGPRAYSVGLERSWLSRDWRWAGAMLGFRTGLVYGYDGRLGWLAEKYPILPFAQPVIYTELGPVAADFTYTWVVVSLSAAVRF